MARLSVKELVDEFLQTDFVCIKDFLKECRIIYDEMILEQIIEELATRCKAGEGS